MSGSAGPVAVRQRRARGDGITADIGDSRITRAAYSLHSRGLIAYMTYRRRALLWPETVRDPCVLRHGEPRGRLRWAEATEYR
jgi:hypothetical protein